MNLLDYVLVAILGYCLIRGVFRGLIKELTSIIGVLGGFYAAYTYYPQLASLWAQYLEKWISNPAWVSILSFLTLFVLIFFGISLTGVVIKYLVNVAFLGWTDRICGALFGSAKGVLITSVIILALTTFLPKNSAMIKNSWLSHHLMQCSALLIKVAPKDMKQLFGTKAKELHKSWQKQ